MKNLLLILAVIALIVLLAGALNHGVEVSVDYLVGTTSGFSLFWVSVALAAALVLAGLAGWSVGRAGAGDARRKLEKELETTYRRLREAESRAAALVVGGESEAAPTVALVQADEARTAVREASAGEAGTAGADSEAETAVTEAPSTEAETAVAQVPANEAETAVTETPADPADEAGGEDGSMEGQTPS